MEEYCFFRNTLEVLAEVSERVVRDLGKEAIREAEDITLIEGEVVPQALLDDAESITYISAVFNSPQELLSEAEAITRLGSE